MTRKTRNLLRKKFTHRLLEICVRMMTCVSPISPVVAAPAPMVDPPMMMAEVSVTILESDFVLSIVRIVSRSCGGAVAYTGSQHHFPQGPERSFHEGLFFPLLIVLAPLLSNEYFLINFSPNLPHRCVEKVEAYRTNPLQFLKSFHSTNFVLDIKLFERTF